MGGPSGYNDITVSVILSCPFRFLDPGFIELGRSTDEYSMLSLYAFSNDTRAASMRLRSVSSNVCQFASRFALSLGGAMNEIAVELSRLRLSGSMANMTLR